MRAMSKQEQQSLFADAAPATAKAQRVAFDIETANLIAPDADLDSAGPLLISCSAAVTDTGLLRHWYMKDERGAPHGTLDAATALDMLQWLRQQQLAGVKVCAWNGLSFDLRWISHAAGDRKLAAEIALDLYDPMFQFMCQRGFPIGLASVGEALGIGEKKLMSGADAPQEWASGNRQRVLDYVAGDCRITEAIVARIVELREVRWKTKKGTLSREPMRALLKVRECLALPLPDTSWMGEPIPREKFYAWLELGK
jgi:hypothetical protein